MAEARAERGIVASLAAAKHRRRHRRDSIARRRTPIAALERLRGAQSIYAALVRHVLCVIAPVAPFFGPSPRNFSACCAVPLAVSSSFFPSPFSSPVSSAVHHSSPVFMRSTRLIGLRRRATKTSIRKSIDCCLAHRIDVPVRLLLVFQSVTDCARCVTFSTLIVLANNSFDIFRRCLALYV